MWNITKFCQDNHIQYRLPNTPFVQIETCPFCGHTNYKAAFSITKKGVDYFNCWACKKVPAHEAVAAFLFCSIMEGKEILWSYKGSIDRKLLLLNQERKNAQKVDLPGDKKLLNIHKKYLIGRDFDPDELQSLWDVRGTGIAPDPPYHNWRYRLIVPIKLNGEIVSFQARDVTGRAEIRYLGATIEQSVYHYKNLLYGQEYCEGDVGAGVEGIFDMYRMGKGVVCLFGTSVSPAQLNLIARHFKRFFFLFDPDDPNSKKKMKQNCLLLKAMGCDARAVSWDGSDPGDLSADDAQYLRRQIGV